MYNLKQTLHFQVLLLESILGWAGVLDELEYAKRLQRWCFSGFTELGDETGIVLSETVKQVFYEYTNVY